MASLPTTTGARACALAVDNPASGVCQRLLEELVQSARESLAESRQITRERRAARLVLEETVRQSQRLRAVGNGTAG